MTLEEQEIFNSFQERFINSLTLEEKKIYTNIFVRAKEFPFLENNIDNYHLLLSFQEILDSKAPLVIRQMAEDYLQEEKEILSKEEYEIVVNEEIKYLEFNLFGTNDFTNKKEGT